MLCFKLEVAELTVKEIMFEHIIQSLFTLLLLSPHIFCHLYLDSDYGISYYWLSFHFCTQDGSKGTLWLDVVRENQIRKWGQKRIIMKCLVFLWILNPVKSKKLTGNCKRSITQILLAKRFFFFFHFIFIITSFKDLNYKNIRARVNL